MSEETFPLIRLTWRRFVWAVKNLLASDRSPAAYLLAGILVLGILLINGLNVINSFVGRDFMSSIEWRDSRMFWEKGGVYALVFVISAIAATLFRYVEERLGLLWREQLTRYFTHRYLENRTYLLMASMSKVANPDQRISEDVRAFTTTTLSFLLMLFNGFITVLSFSGVLWSISPLLFAVALAYALCGSLVAAWLGKPLIRLNYLQLDMEATFRSDLIHLRENADAIALGHREGRFGTRISHHLSDLVANLRKIIAVNRNLGFFTNGYNYFIQLIPALIIAPMFIHGDLEFGVVTQSTMAFATLMGAFSLIVTQFQSISAFAAVTTRLHLLSEGIDHVRERGHGEIHFEETEETLTYEKLSLFTPDRDRVLVRAVDFSLPPGAQLVVTSHENFQKLALFRATARVWPCGEGTIHRPDQEGILFLPERPYWPPGVLRNALLRSGREHTTADLEIHTVLEKLLLTDSLIRAGGLDAERDWNDVFSLSEQHLFNIARLLLSRPRMVVLDRPGSSLALDQIAGVLPLFREARIAVILTSSHGETSLPFDFYLHIFADGSWTTGAHRPDQYFQVITPHEAPVLV